LADPSARRGLLPLAKNVRLVFAENQETDSFPPWRTTSSWKAESKVSMRRIHRVFALTTVAAVLSGCMLFAQDHQDDRDHHDNQHYVRHDEWHKGAHIEHKDWDRGERVDYRHYHLQQPPHGYEWREVDGNYVLAAVTTGVIASVIAASAAH
jgi:Ni/Co efflux regulator RcnB